VNDIEYDFLFCIFLLYSPIQPAASGVTNKFSSVQFMWNKILDEQCQATGVYRGHAHWQVRAACRQHDTMILSIYV